MYIYICISLGSESVHRLNLAIFSFLLFFFCHVNSRWFKAKVRRSVSALCINSVGYTRIYYIDGSPSIRAEYKLFAQRVTYVCTFPIATLYRVQRERRSETQVQREIYTQRFRRNARRAITVYIQREERERKRDDEDDGTISGHSTRYVPRKS